jgi:hypothetical protein
MKRLSAITVLLVLLISFGCKKESIEVPANENSCIVTFVSGDAFLINEDNTDMVQLTIGDSLSESSIVKTDADSTVELKIGDGSLVRVKENSRLEITKLYKDEEVANTKLHLSMGTLMAVPEEVMDGSSFEIETESITAGVRGTEFVVIVSETRVSRVAVNKGLVRVQKRLKIDSPLDRIRGVNPELAEKLNSAVREEIILEPDEKVEISYEKIVQFESEITSEIVKIAEQLEDVKDSVDDLESLIKQVEDKKVTEISSVTRTMLTRKEISKKEWKQDFKRDEFKNITIEKANKRIKDIKEAEGNTTEVESELESEAETATTEKENETEIENEAEKEPEPVTVFEKVGSAGITFTSRYTAISSDKKNIYAVDKEKNRIVAYSGKSGKVLWKFTDPAVSIVYSPAVPFKNKIIIPAENKIIILDSAGKVVTSKDISMGPINWASSVITGDKVYIPTRRSLFAYDNNSIEQVSGLEFTGLTYISASKNSIVITDSLNNKIKIFDLASSSVSWESDQLSTFVFAPAVIAGNYLVATDNDGSMYRYSYKDGTTTPQTLKIGSGVLSNMVVSGSSVYFVANNGALYSVNINKFSQARKIYAIDKADDQNTYAAKRLVKNGDDFYFSSNTGKLFHYNKKSGKAEMLTISDNKGNKALVGSPAVVGDTVLVVDTSSTIYKRHTVYR